MIENTITIAARQAPWISSGKESDMNEPTTTDELVAVIKATLCPYGLVHVDQVLAWLQRQADITRAECMAEEVADGRTVEEIRPVA